MKEVEESSALKLIKLTQRTSEVLLLEGLKLGKGNQPSSVKSGFSGSMGEDDWDIGESEEGIVSFVSSPIT